MKAKLIRNAYKWSFTDDEELTFKEGTIVETLSKAPVFDKTSNVWVYVCKLPDGTVDDIAVCNLKLLNDIDWEQRRFELYVTMLQSKYNRREAAERAAKCIESYRKMFNL